MVRFLRASFGSQSFAESNSSFPRPHQLHHFYLILYASLLVFFVFEFVTLALLACRGYFSFPFPFVPRVFPYSTQPPWYSFSISVPPFSLKS